MADKKTSGVTEGSTHVQGGSFQIAEAYKMIRTNLLFTLANTDKRTVVFSSAEPSAGKSTLCANLAIVMAQMGIRVLLIDADMRRPALSRLLMEKANPGLSEVLGGIVYSHEAIRKDVYPNLDILFSGETPPNPSELLGSDTMRELIDSMSQVYDYILVDTPPVGVVSDASIVTSLLDGVLLLVRQGWARKETVKRALENLERTGIKPLGYVLNGVDLDEKHFDHYYY